MDILPQVLEDLWAKKTGKPNEVEWFNVDSPELAVENALGSAILRLRRNGATDSGGGENPSAPPTPFCGPIILYGFRPWETLLSSQSISPEILASPGIYYLLLPVSYRKLNMIFARAAGFKTGPTVIKSYLKDRVFMGDRLARLESRFAHRRGNFLGAERLLYGAFLAGKIDREPFFNLLSEIREKQKEFLQEQGESDEFLEYLQFSDILIKEDNIAMASNPATSGQLQCVSPTDQGTTQLFDLPIKGNILYIDDHAHLGWAQAVAVALGANAAHSGNDKREYYTFDEYSSETKDLMITVINSDGSQADEQKFVEEVSDVISNEDILKITDIILLDLYLQGKHDEEISEDQLDKISSIGVLRKIREKNAAIPVIMLTASRKAKNMEKVLGLGADAYLMKQSSSSFSDSEEIRQYYRDFVGKIGKAMGKAYLAEAWRLLLILEQKEEKEFRKTEHKDKNLTKNKLQWQNEVIGPLKKSLALLRKNNNEFEKYAFGLEVLFTEAIVNLNYPREALQQKRIKNKLIYNYQLDKIDNGELLAGLRNCAMHNFGQLLDEFDCRVALYLSFRSFFRANELNDLRQRLFPNQKLNRANRERYIENIIWNSHNKLNNNNDLINNIMNKKGGKKKEDIMLPKVRYPKHNIWSDAENLSEKIKNFRWDTPKTIQYLTFLRKLDNYRDFHDCDFPVIIAICERVGLSWDKFTGIG